MKRLFIFVFFSCWLPFGVQAQPCTPLHIVPMPWPKDRGHRQELQVEIAMMFGFAGGLYFATYMEGFGTVDNVVYNFLSAVGPTPWQLETLPMERDGARDHFLASPVFLRGNFYAVGLGFYRASDGKNWRMLSGGEFLWPLQWTGEEFVLLSQFGSVWKSRDGESWHGVTGVPGACRPMWTGLADRFRLVVAGPSWNCEPTTGFLGYTEDYRTFFLKPVPTPPRGDFDALGNGWFFGPGYKTRDGKDWLPVALALESETSPRGGYSPPSSFFSGRELVGVLQFFEFQPPRSELWLTTTPDGDGWKRRLLIDFYENPRLDPKAVYLVGAAWDGKNLWMLCTTSHRGKIEETSWLVWTSCADLGDPVVLPGVAHGAGAGTSFWKTSLSLHYPGPGEGEVLIQWLPFGGENRNPQERRMWLNSGESREFSDVLGELFGVSGFGSLRVVSVRNAVVAHARTYNDEGTGSFGQGLAPWRWEDGIGPEDEGWLAGLSESPNLAEGFRTNVGVQNLWVDEVLVEVVFRDKEGQELGRKQKRLGAFEGFQLYRPLLEWRPEGLPLASALVRVIEGEGKVAAYASRVDNRTGDATFIRAYRLPRQNTVR